MSNAAHGSELGLSKNSTGLIVGAFVGFWHVLWSFLVATSLAQSLIDWIYGLHFLNNPFRVADFNVGTAALLVFISFSAGYLMGWLFAFLWNALRGRHVAPRVIARAA